MRKFLNWAVFGVLAVIVVVVGMLITPSDEATLVEPTAKDATLQISASDEILATRVTAEMPIQSFPYIYIVKRGDWLSTICSGDWEGVAKLNKLENPDLIYPGQRLELTDACEDSNVLADEEVKAPADMIPAENADTLSESEDSERVAETERVVALPITSSTTVVEDTVIGQDADGLIQCDVTLPLGEKAFQWRQPGRHPIGDEDPQEYMDVLARTENLPDEAREYFLAELRKGDKGAFVVEKLSRCQYLGTMVGKKVNGTIRPHRHTILN